jgi:hypothetical protein
MVPHRAIIEDEPADVPDWFNKARRNLFETWRDRTGHDAQCSPQRWACEIARRCERSGQHLSIPCSVGLDADEIGLFLKPNGYADDPIIFLRLYLMMLYEFTDALRKVNQQLELKLPERPKNLVIWSNQFAKHRAHLHFQHHPAYAFADCYGPAWKGFYAVAHTKHFIDGCGNRRPLAIIDQAWLCDEERKRDESITNGLPQALILVPPLAEFLASTMDYFRMFVDACLRQPDAVRQFESLHFHHECIW